MTRITNTRNSVDIKCVRDGNVLRRWREKLSNEPCWVCGGAARRNCQMSLHHIVGGPRRSHEECNFIWCGWVPCHNRMEGIRVIRRGEVFEPISLDEQIQIRSKFPGHDYRRLCELAGRDI